MLAAWTGAATPEDSVAVSQETKRTLPGRCGARAPRCLPDGGKSLRAHENPHSEAYGGFPPNCPNLGATQMPLRK